MHGITPENMALNESNPCSTAWHAGCQVAHAPDGWCHTCLVVACHCLGGGAEAGGGMFHACPAWGCTWWWPHDGAMHTMMRGPTAAWDLWQRHVAGLSWDPHKHDTCIHGSKQHLHMQQQLNNCSCNSVFTWHYVHHCITCAETP